MRMKVAKEQFIVDVGTIVHEPTNAVYRKTDRGIELVRRGQLGETLPTGDYYDVQEVAEAARAVLALMRATSIG